MEDSLDGHVRLLPICPEVDLGLGIPREPIQIELAGDKHLLIARESRSDLTEAMQKLACSLFDEMRGQGLHGMVLKSRSPSCGLIDTAHVDGESGVESGLGAGLFASTISEQDGVMPMIDEICYQCEEERSWFLTRVFARARLEALFKEGWKARDVVAFHSREKMLLLAHSQRHYRQLGPLVAGLAGRRREDFVCDYSALFLEALARQPDAGQHVNVLEHMLGHFKKREDQDARHALHGAVRRFAVGESTLVECRDLFRRALDSGEIPYLAQQSWFAPYPADLSRI